MEPVLEPLFWQVRVSPAWAERSGIGVIYELHVVANSAAKDLQLASVWSYADVS